MGFEDEEDDEGQQQLQQQWPSSPIPHINGLSGEQQANPDQHSMGAEPEPVEEHQLDYQEQQQMETNHGLPAANFTMDEPQHTTQSVFNFLVIF